MNWVDSHAHLNDDAFQEDLERVIDNALEAGVKTILVPGFDLSSSLKAVELAQSYQMLWAAVGVHPHDAKTWNQATANHVEKLLVEPKVIAVGEIGLDYHYNYSTKEEQLRAFIEQINIAAQYNKPIIIHNREAHQDTFEVLTREKLGERGGVMHCFSGSKETAMEFLRLGLHISFAGSLTFTNASKLREAAKVVPLDKLLVETDSPYLTPHPLRGRRNGPAYVKLVGQKLAEILDQPIETIMDCTTVNTENLFGISCNGNLM